MSGTERRGLGYRCRRCAPRSRPESVLTHTVTHTGNERTEAVEQTGCDLILFGQKTAEKPCIDDCEVVVEE